MKVVRNSIVPVNGFDAMNLFGVLFVREDTELTPALLNHEEIHTAQMKELGYVLFYLIYLAEWLYRHFKAGNAYMNISFEREAYSHENDLEYLGKRKPFAMWRRIT